MEPGVDRRPLQLIAGGWREPSSVALELSLDRLEDVDDIRPGTALELELGGAEGQVHGPRMTRRAGRRPGRPESRDGARSMMRRRDPGVAECPPSGRYDARTRGRAKIGHDG